MQMLVGILSLSCAFAVSVKKIAKYDDNGSDDEPLPKLEDIPEEHLRELLKEIPDLLQILSSIEDTEFLPTNDTDHKPDHENRKPEQHLPTNTQKSGRRIYQAYPYDDPSGWNIYFSNNWVGKKNFYLKRTWYPVISCYWCGINISTFIPTTSICHDAFESQDHRLRAVQRFFRGICYYVNPVFVNMGNIFWYDWRYMGTYQSDSEFVYGSYIANPSSWKDREWKGKWGRDFSGSSGLKRQYFGQYIGGCFKRFLDVGTVYTQRGCKHYWPIQSYGDNPVSHRFRKLEYVLRFQKEGCVRTNHASLTPFNRGVSLYARYHVCVCSTPYCNRGAARTRVNTATLLATTIALTRIFI